MEKRTARLTQGSVGRHLVNMTLPMLLGITTMMAQAFIDTWFLGQVGDRALAAYSFGFPILMIMISVAIGLGAGTSSVVARALGGDDHARARRLSTDSLILSLVISLVLAITGVLTIDPLFRALGAPADMLPMIRPFMTILYAAVPFIMLGMVGTASMRATGDTLLPGKLMIGAAILNVLLDPILIFGLGPIPALGLNGAAIAAFVSRGVFFAVSTWYLRYRLDLVSFGRPAADEMRKSWRDVLHVGLPAAGTNVIVPMGLALVTAMIADFGPKAVAGFGVASRIESLVLVPYYALSSIIGPFVGQNLSAHLESRIMLALRLCAMFCIVSGLVVAGLLAAASGFLPTLFSDSAGVIDVTRTFLWIAPLGYGAYGIVMYVNAAFNGLGKPMPGVAVSVMRIVVLYIPLAFLGKALYGIDGIFGAYAAANLLSGAIGYLWAKGVVRRLFSFEKASGA
ncbi:MAG: MATE family efflux transporter [Woeseiaceae bacterium]